MRIGVLCLPTDDWPTWIERANRLESLGYEHLWTYDHLSWREYIGTPWHSAIPLLTATAAATTRIQLGTMVASPNFRHPVPFAHELMTLDRIAGGRFILGVGSGGTGPDSRAQGQAAWSPAERTARCREFVATLDTLLSQPETTMTGEYYSAVDVRIVPGCVREPRLPFAIAAAGPKALALVARYGDTWITEGYGGNGGLPIEQWRTNIRTQWATIEAECERIGRDPGEIQKSFTTGFLPDPVLSTINAFEDFVGELTECGFTDVVFHYPRPDDERWNFPAEMVEQIADRMIS